jgi:hypothetical protein
LFIDLSECARNRWRPARAFHLSVGIRLGACRIARDQPVDAFRRNKRAPTYAHRGQFAVFDKRPELCTANLAELPARCSLSE